MDATDSPAHRLYRIVYVDVVQMCSAPLDFYELERVARAQPEAFDEFFSDYRELERLIARVIRQGVAAGEFRDVDATATTTAALALSEGLQYRFRQGEQDVRRMRELAHLSASTTVAALVRDRRRVRSARAAAERVGLTESTHFQYSIEKLPSEGFDDTSKTRRRRTSPGRPSPEWEYRMDSGNTAWLLTAVLAVALMLPGLVLFYGGMISRRTTMNMMLMVFVSFCLTAFLWVAFGYSMVFGDSVGGAGLVGDPLEFAGLGQLLEAPEDAPCRRSGWRRSTCASRD